MKGVGVHEFGGPEALQVVDLPEPEPGRGEVRIRTHAAAVNPTDTLLRAGGQAQRLGGRPGPYVPGMDLAGTVDAIGPDGSGRFGVGDRVIALVVPTGAHGGAYAEQVVVPEASVVPVPEGAGDPAASTLLMNAMTARLALDAVAAPAGGTIAVTGAAGAFGGYAIQLAKADGLRVVADAAAPDEALVRSLGADEVIARGDGVAQRIRDAAPYGVDAVLDGAVQNELMLPAIRDGGALATVRGWSGPGERGISVHPVMVARSATETGALDRLRQQAGAGFLDLRVAEVLPAAEAPEAHRRLEAGGVRGRIVLDFTTLSAAA